ncbi:MAG: asparagine synthase (glutamine-hydrolyzing) [Patescibacteria group bacterium]|nr:asparagine synthase (glutamine-hydrolyzing) [Patescibacteria group bacterium]
MCGIAGIVKTDGSAPEEGLLRSMSRSIIHRGPDGSGLWSSSGVGLVHRRLAIIELNDFGRQPMIDETGSLALVFNGEIYNYKELRDDLAALGAKFRTNTDTEVIIEAYRAWGTSCVKRFRGMFAFALWDGHEKKLFAARDAIGKKPFFYALLENGDLAFASEIKALGYCLPLRPDWNAVRLFLGLQYVPSPLTGFDGVRQLSPGHFFVWHDGKMEMTQYNDWNDHRISDQGSMAKSEDELAKMLLEKLEDSVKVRQLAADVPVGAFLSGGIDSAAVVAMAVKHVARPLQTFTMGFPVMRLDERREAREIAKFFHTDHYEFEARPDDMIELLDELVAHYDAPYADSSALPVWLLSKETAKEIKVVLNGDGGDELFGGYRRYGAYERALRLCEVPIIGSMAAPASIYVGRILRDVRFKRMGETVRTLNVCRELAYGELFCGSYFSTKRLPSVFRRDFLEKTESTDAVQFVAKQMDGGFGLGAAMFFDLTSYLPDDLNAKMDRATMRFGLEARAPFLDQEMVKFALSVPLKYKVNQGKKKILLRRALAGVLPDDVLNRPKRGFQVPLAQWFRGPMAKVLEERCLGVDSPLREIADEQGVRRLISRNAKGFDHGNRLWMLLTLSSWLYKNR